jgi:hypothetical protein
MDPRRSLPCAKPQGSWDDNLRQRQQQRQKQAKRFCHNSREGKNPFLLKFVVSPFIIFLSYQAFFV